MSTYKVVYKVVDAKPRDEDFLSFDTFPERVLTQVKAMIWYKIIYSFKPLWLPEVDKISWETPLKFEEIWLDESQFNKDIFMDTHSNLRSVEKTLGDCIFNNTSNSNRDFKVVEVQSRREVFWIESDLEDEEYFKDDEDLEKFNFVYNNRFYVAIHAKKMN